MQTPLPLHDQFFHPIPEDTTLSHHERKLAVIQQLSTLETPDFTCLLNEIIEHFRQTFAPIIYQALNTRHQILKTVYETGDPYNTLETEFTKIHHPSETFGLEAWADFDSQIQQIAEIIKIIKDNPEADINFPFTLYLTIFLAGPDRLPYRINPNDPESPTNLREMYYKFTDLFLTKNPEFEIGE